MIILKSSLGIVAPFALLLNSGCVSAQAPAAAPASLAKAEAPIVSDAMKQTGEGLVAMINGKVHPNKVFSARFLAQRAPEHLIALAGKLNGRFGPALGVSRIESTSPTEGTIFIDFEQSQLPFKVALDPSDSGLIIGLAVSGG
jgi:hypothetical protein